MNARLKMLLIVSQSIGLLALVSCGKTVGEKGGSGGSQFRPMSPVPASYDVQPLAVANQSCMSLAKVVSQIKALPADAIMRKVTTKFDIADKTNQGSRPRENLVSMLGFSSFTFSEKPAQELSKDLVEVQQNDCATVIFSYEDEQASEFTVKEYTNSSIKIAQGENVEMTFSLISPRELQVTTTQDVMDFCPDYKTVKATVQYSYKWTPGSQPQNLEENVNVDLLKTLSSSIVDPPHDLSRLATSAQSGQIAVPVSTLSSLTHAEIRHDLQVCPRTNTPPDGNEPVPPIDLAPTPTPIPGATPSPDGTIPTPTPEPTPEPEV